MDYLKLDRYYFDVAYKMKQWRRIQFLGMIVEYAFSGKDTKNERKVTNRKGCL